MGKAFQCQKVGRKLKQLKEEQQQTKDKDAAASSSRTVDDAKKDRATDKITALEEKMESIKSFDLDKLVSVSLKRLGLTTAAAISQHASSADSDANANRDNEREQQLLVDSMLLNKRLSDVME